MEPIVGKLCLAKTIKARHLTIFPEVLHKLAGGAAEQRCDVVIQRVHVLCQPGCGVVVHLQTKQHQCYLGSAISLFLIILPKL